MPFERSHPRIPVSVPATITLSTPEGSVTRAEKIANLSLGGVFIEMKDPPPFGTEVSLELKLEGAPSAFRCKGFVVWSTRNTPDPETGRTGAGIRLTGLGITEMKELSSFVNGRLEGHKPSAKAKR